MHKKEGSILIFFYLVLIVFSILLANFLTRSIVENRAALRQRELLQAYYLAEAGINEVKRGLFDTFRQIYPHPTPSDFSWFDTLPDPDKYTLPVNATLSTVRGGRYTVNITNVTSLSEGRDVTFVSEAWVGNTSKRITAVVRYGLRPSRVFDYAYFINNYGWFWGGGIRSQGDIRSNGDFSFWDNPTVNGDIYASINPELGANGDISGNSRHDDISYYRNHADSTARPTNPTADEEGCEYPDGYDGSSKRFSHSEMLNMPYLGDLNYYKSLAISQGGTIKQGGVTLVNGVLDDNIVLIGTEDNPIEVNGPVVVTGDVLIKGVVTGQGTIYSGRNTHIIGDITYKNPPVWPKPDTDPDTTDAQNAEKDFLGLSAKGNIIVGDYTRNDWQTVIEDYIKPPFTKAYKVDPSDSDIGYVQYYVGDDPYFNGDYTAFDGGKKIDGEKRRFYESSFSDSYVHSIAEPSNKIHRVDAVTYTNHLFSGRVGSFTMNGSIVARDEAIVYSGSITMNYDIRVKKGVERYNFYLPRELDIPRTRYMEEN